MTLLSSRDIAVLNRARKVLERLEDAAWRGSLDHHDPYGLVTAWDLGRLSDAASVADDALMHVLSTARNNCRVKVTDDQLLGTAHEQPPTPPAPEAGEPAAVHEPSPAPPSSPVRGAGESPLRALPRVHPELGQAGESVGGDGSPASAPGIRPTG